ncbi:MAG: MiaB/RimO family radical SAM methylthiotransferase [Candidatus Omnitrophota bacterium]
MSGTKKNTPHFRMEKDIPTLPNGECKKPHAEACGEHKRAKTFFIKVFGCQMSFRDSELVAGLLIKEGFQIAKTLEEADIILLNTCSVRQKAEDKVWSEIGKLKLLKDDHSLRSLGRRRKDVKDKNVPRPSEEQSDEQSSFVSRKIVGLLGCMAENYQQAAFTKSSYIDLVVGPNNIASIPGLLKDLQTGFGKALAVGKTERDTFVYNTKYIAEKSHCNVNITEGCNNFCTYCIVPYVRGRERSRDAEQIIKEIKSLVKKGVTEITLLGQNVNSYKSQVTGHMSQAKKIKNKSINPAACSLQLVSFIDLLHMVNEIKGLKSFDFVTSHPKDANLALFKTMAKLEKCKKFLHLPVQSGSDRILKQMNRGYPRTQFIKLAQAAKKIIPGLRLTTDVMVGFPTETEKDFQDTFDLMKQVEFDAAYIFKYSPRPQTKAAELEDDVPVEVKKKRNQILLDFQKKLHQVRKKSSK